MCLLVWINLLEEHLINQEQSKLSIENRLNSSEASDTAPELCNQYWMTGSNK